MKFGITKYELFALTSHLVALPSPTPEVGEKRIQAWAALGTEELADQLTTGATVGGEIALAEWRDKKTWHLIDLPPEILVHVINGLRNQLRGEWSDTLTRLRIRLEHLRDKIYDLPPELRTLSAVAP